MFRFRFVRWALYAAIPLIAIFFAAQSFGTGGSGQDVPQAAPVTPPNAMAEMSGADWAVVVLIIAGLCVFLLRARRRPAAGTAPVKRER
ncbi:MAG: hypothetical protein ACE15C_14975 [Phycisphaerae bacterium]